MEFDQVTRGVIRRWKLASATYAENHWNDAVAELQQFQVKYEQLMRLHQEDVTTDAAQKLLGEFAFKKDGTAPTFTGTAFRQWLSYGVLFPLELKDDPDGLRPAGSLAIEVADGKKPLQVFQDAIEAYANSIQAAINLAGSARFTYSGFSVSNSYRMSDGRCRMLLEGIDYVVALFKKRGLDHLFKENVNKVELVPSLGGTTLGFYHIKAKTITLSSMALRQNGPGRFMSWVQEVFLHEFGHHIHLSILPAEAREAWNSGWGEVKSKKEAIAVAFQKITKSERETFFDTLMKSDWDPSKAAKRLGSTQKVKFGVWLRSPMVGDPLITEKQFRLTKQGQYIASFFKDRQRFLAEHSYDESDVPRIEKRMRDKLGLLYDGAYPIPSEVVTELTSSDPAMQKAVDEAIAKLDIVSDYGKTNQDEDFAESFVAFIGAPEKLTENAKFRMQRALSLAGLYGKHIMHLARKRSAVKLPLASR